MNQRNPRQLMNQHVHIVTPGDLFFRSFIIMFIRQCISFRKRPGLGPINHRLRALETPLKKNGRHKVNDKFLEIVKELSQKYAKHES